MSLDKPTTSSVATEVFDVVPSYSRVAVMVRGVANSGRLAIRDDIRNKALHVAMRTASALRDDPWFELYGRLGHKPKKNLPAHLNLARSVIRQGELFRINPLVDAMNLTSLLHGVPVGGDDLDLGGSTYCLRPATGAETFKPLGKNAAELRVPRGEFVYVAEQLNAVCCRRWNWRNGATTSITPSTSTVLINIDCLGGMGLADSPLETLRHLVSTLSPSDIEIGAIDSSAPVCTFH